MIIISKDVTDPNAIPFAIADHSIINANGSTSFVNADGTVVGQEPNVYGKHDDAPDVAHIGVYQMFTVNGPLASVLTRPGDKPFVYTIASVQSF